MKKFTIFLLFFSLLFANLTNKEKNYLKNNNIIKVCINPNWAPIEFRNEKGDPEGISIDILKILSDKLHLKLQFIKTSSWSESQQFLKEKKCDILPSAIMTDERKKYAIFTKPYLSYKLAVITTNDKPIINSLDEIVDKPMSRKRGSGLIAKMKKLYPDIKIVQTKGYIEAFNLVHKKKVYFTIATIPVFEYYKRKYSLDNLIINGYTDFKYNLRMVVRKDKLILRNILDKSLNSITPNMKRVIYEKWAINVKPEINYKKYIIVILIVIVFILLIFLFISYQNYYLKKRIELATKEIGEEKEKIKKIVDNVMEAVVIANDNLMIVDVNKRAETIFGYKKEEVIGKSMLDFVQKNEANILKETYEVSEPFEIVRKRKDGLEVVCLVTRTFFIENNKRYRVSMFVDITKHKEQEIMLAQQSKSVALGEMIGNIAHQWRQPLANLSMIIESFEIKNDLGKLNTYYIKNKTKEALIIAENMSKTIEDFRNFFLPDKIKKRFFIKDCLDKTIKLISFLIEKNHIELKINIKNDINIIGYPNETSHVCINFITNSIEALIDSDVKAKKILITIKETKNYIIISIIDNAGGIDEKIIDKIFEPYFTTKIKQQGTGIGLYMSNQIISNMNGEIKAKNIIHKMGTNKFYKCAMFEIILPKDTNEKL